MDFVTRSWAKGSSSLPFVAFALLCAVAVSVSGCADLMADDALQQDVAQLRQDVNKLMQDSRRGRGEAEAVNQIEARIRERASESSRQMATLSTRIGNLNAEISRVSARLEQVSQRLESLSRQASASGASNPRVEPPTSPPAPAISRTMPASPPPSAAPSAPSPTGSPLSARPALPPAGPSPEESYQAAYLDFSKGHYSLAIPAFRAFIRRFPDSPLADSAQYAVGESHFSMARASAAAGQVDKATRELEQAVQEFRRVILNYPRGSKVPTALYKEALVLTELKQPTLARDRLQYLLDHFPQSEEAPLAKEQLAALRR